MPVAARADAGLGALCYASGMALIAVRAAAFMLCALPGLASIVGVHGEVLFGALTLAALLGQLLAQFISLGLTGVVLAMPARAIK